MPYHEFDFADTNNGDVNAELLEQQIEDAGGWSPTFQGLTILSEQSKIRTLWSTALVGGEFTALSNIVSAHDGLITEAYNHVVRKVSLTSIASGLWTSVITLTTPSLKRGWYRIEAQIGIQTQDAPVVPFVDFAEGRFTENLNGAGPTTLQFVSGLFNFGSSQTAVRYIYVDHGDVLEFTIEGRKQGNAVCEIRDATLVFEPHTGSVS